MKLRQISFKIVSFVMVVTMMFSICATTISAAYWEHDNHVHANEKKTITYVSIGDSMTNGYGNEGYDGMSGIVNYANSSYANQFAAYLAGYTGEIADNQVIFEGSNGIVDHRQLAMSGMRAEDLNWVLGLDYTDEAKIEEMINMYFNFYNFRQSFPQAYNWGPEYNVDISELWYADDSVYFPKAGFSLDGWGFNAGDRKTFEIFFDGGHRYADGAAKILATYFDPTSDAYNYYHSFLETEDAKFQTYVNNAVAGLATNEYYPEYNQNRLYEIIDGWMYEPNGKNAELGRYRYLQIATEFYQESIKDADVISLALGNTNFGTYMLNDILAVVSDNDTKTFAKNYDIEKVYDLLRSKSERADELEEDVRKIIYDCQELIGKMVADLAADEDEKLQAEKTEAIKYIVTYYILSYIVNYEMVLEHILRVNPDVEIIQVALVNAYASSKETTEATIGDLAELIYGPMNAYLAALPTYRKAQGFDIYKDATFYFANSGSVDVLVDEFGNDFYKKDGEYVDYNGPLALTDNSGYVANNKSTVRDRLYKFIVGQNYNGELFAKARDGMTKLGLQFDTKITLKEIAAYDLMTESQKEDYAFDYQAKAVACATYLALEHAIIESGKEPATLSSLSKLSESDAAFLAVFEDFAKKTDGLSKMKKTMTISTLLADLIINDADVSALFCVYARIKVGEGIGGHATASGNDKIANAVINAYYTGHTSEDECIKNMGNVEALTEALYFLVPFVLENYRGIYADVYEQLEEDGYIKIAYDYVDLAIRELELFIVEDYDNIWEYLDLSDDYKDTKDLLKAELEAAVVTLRLARELLDNPVIGYEMWEELDVLYDDLTVHHENIKVLVEEVSVELGKDIRASLYVALQNLGSLIREAGARVEEYLPTLYDNVCKAAAAMFETYGPVVVDMVYKWFLANSDEILYYLGQCGEGMVDYIVANSDVIFGTMAFIAVNYGEDIFYFVLDKAEILFPELTDWFRTYGDDMWDLIVVFTEVVVYLYENGDLTIEGFKAAIKSFDETLYLIKDNFAEVITAIKTSDSSVLEALDEAIFELYSRVDAEFDEEDVLVSIGGNNAVADEDHYANLVADKLGITAALLHNANLRVSDLRALLDASYEVDEYGKAVLAGVDAQAYIDAIVNADAITVEFGVEDFTTFAFAQVVGYLSETLGENFNLSEIIPGFDLELGSQKAYEMNWDIFGDFITEERVNKILAKVEDVLAEQDVPAELVLGNVTIDVVELVEFAAESYLYAVANYVYNYGATIEAIRALNADAPIIVLGAFNPFDGIEIALDDMTINLDVCGDLFARALDVNTLANITDMDNTYYVFIGSVETMVEADGIIGIGEYVFFGEDNTLLFSTEALDASEAGHEYIAAQLLKALNAEVNDTIPCAHEYDDCEDDTCNLCGETRKAPGHKFIYCDDTDCSVCGKENVREAGEHAYDSCTDTTCYKCPFVRVAGAHTFDGCLDTDCNNPGCSYKRIAAHTYAEVCSEKCIVCGATRVSNNHTYGEWQLVEEATRKADGSEKHVCSVCGKVETRPVPFVGLSGGAIAGIISGSTVVAGAGGFAVFWFAVKKKSFADLVGAVKALAGK